MFHDRPLPGRCFRGFVRPVLEYCSATGARLRIHTLNYCTVQSVVPGFNLGVCLSMTLVIVDPRPSCVCFIRSGVTRCNPVYPLNGALPGPYVPVRVTRGALVAHRYAYALPRCRTSQYSRTFIPISVSLWNDLAYPVFEVFDGVGLEGFKSRTNAFFIGLSCSVPTIVFYSFSLSLLSVYM